MVKMGTSMSVTDIGDKKCQHEVTNMNINVAIQTMFFIIKGNHANAS